VLGSKAVGEPSVLGGVSVLLALRRAVASVRRDGGLPAWTVLDGPATPERVAAACALDPARLLP
jgi:xanthine dehydrogenase/oxidase